MFSGLLGELKISFSELKLSCGELKIEKKPSQKELWASDFEVLGVFGAPKGHQGSLKEVSKRAPKSRSIELVE